MQRPCFQILALFPSVLYPWIRRQDGWKLTLCAGGCFGVYISLFDKFIDNFTLGPSQSGTALAEASNHLDRTIAVYVIVVYREWIIIAHG